jgi:hypothetical protein
MDLLKMVEENDYVGLKSYVENRRKELLDKKIEDKKKSIRESVEQKKENTSK